MSATSAAKRPPSIAIRSAGGVGADASCGVSDEDEAVFDSAHRRVELSSVCTEVICLPPEKLKLESDEKTDESDAIQLQADWSCDIL